MMRYVVRAGTLVFAIVSFALMSAGSAAAQRLKAGVLTCDVSAGVGYIIGSSKSVFCNFSPEQQGHARSVCRVDQKIWT